MERYTYLFYPKNSMWLQCNMFWNIKLCRCLDEIEVNVALSLYEKISGLNSDVMFLFNSQDGEPYYMSVNNRKCILSDYQFCEYCDEIRFIMHEPEKDENLFQDARKEQRVILDEAEIMYCVLCLLAVNRTNELDRSDIIRLYFLKCENAFSKYLTALRAFLNNEENLSLVFLEFHIKLIEFVLKKHANNESSNILGDIYVVINEACFKENYQCNHNAEMIKERLENLVIGINADRLPVLNLDIPRYNSTIIAVITDIAKIVKSRYDWNKLKKHFVDIHSHTEAILRLQKRYGENKMKSDVNKLKECLM